MRLSGPEAIPIGREVFRSRPPLGGRIRHVEYGLITTQDGREIDTGLAWVLKRPKSYTGEDTVEISCHGSQMVLETLVQAALSWGATAAAPGEFTRRAFCNGRLDLLQAEAVIDLIRSGSQNSLDTAYGLASGRLSALVRELKSLIIKALSLIEIGLDFTEEDVGEVEQQQVLDHIRQALDLARRLSDTFEGSRRRQGGLLIALIGRPNVGKSTLLNALLGEERAIVTPFPGTTRDLVEGRTVWAGETVRLVDTAGLRKGGEPVEQEGILRSRKIASSADLVIAVFDASTDWQEEDCEVLEWIGQKPAVAVFNKTDLPRKFHNLPPHFSSSVCCVDISALTGEGLVQLQHIAMERVPRLDLVEGIGLTRQRHKDCIIQTIARAESAYQMMLDRQLEECIVAELREALFSLGEMLGEEVGEDVLERIFSDFCIGK